MKLAVCRNCIFLERKNLFELKCGFSNQELSHEESGCEMFAPNNESTTIKIENYVTQIHVQQKDTVETY